MLAEAPAAAHTAAPPSHAIVQAAPDAMVCGEGKKPELLTNPVLDLATEPDFAGMEIFDEGFDAYFEGAPLALTSTPHPFPSALWLGVTAEQMTQAYVKWLAYGMWHPIEAYSGGAWPAFFCHGYMSVLACPSPSPSGLFGCGLVGGLLAPSSTPLASPAFELAGVHGMQDRQRLWSQQLISEPVAGPVTSPFGHGYTLLLVVPRVRAVWALI